MQTMSHTDAPSLALDDIMHTMSPSPTPQSLPPEPTQATVSEQTFPPVADSLDSSPITETSMPPPRIPSPEPLDLSELESMRARVQEYTLTLDSTNQRESDLAAMVLRLTSHLLLQPSPAQLASQAETIADLTFQRNMLLVERADDHARFEAERESWTRNADALLAKASVAQEPIVREQDTQRYISRLEDDNKAFRRRLADTQTRVSALENELGRIRPLLTMQATVLRDSELWHAEALSGLANNRLASFGKKLKGKERATALPNLDSTSVNGRTDRETATTAVRSSHTADSDHTASSSSAPADARPPATQPGPSQSTRLSKAKAEKHPHGHRKDREKDKDRDKEKNRKQRHRSDPVPLLADARAECILAAARKLGRVRAGLISGLVKERHKPEVEAAACPQIVKDCAEDRRTEATSIIETRPSRDGEDPPSSPAIPLAQATGSSQAQSQRPAAVPHPSPTSHPSPRKLAPTPAPPPFSAPAAPHQRGAPHPQLPPHMHPQAIQQYAASAGPAHGRHPHAHPIPHPNFVYYPTNGQGPMPVMVPIPWGVPPGTPPNSHAVLAATTKGKQPQTPQGRAPGDAHTRTPARPQSAPGEANGPSTPMDSLVSAARTLIADEGGEGDGEEKTLQQAPQGADGDGDETEVEEVEREKETPVRRRGTRRRAAGPPAESPAPKRRRTTGGSNGAGSGLSTSAPQLPAAGPSTSAATAPAKTTRRTSKVAVAAAAQEKPKAKGGRGRAKNKPQPAREADSPTPVPGAPAPTQAVPVTRIRSALDVLADQAAQEQERRPSVDAGPSEIVEAGPAIPASGSGSGSGRGRAGSRGAARGRGKGRGRGRGREKGKAVEARVEEVEQPEVEPEPVPEHEPEPKPEHEPEPKPEPEPTHESRPEPEPETRVEAEGDGDTGVIAAAGEEGEVADTTLAVDPKTSQVADTNMDLDANVQTEMDAPTCTESDAGVVIEVTAGAEMVANVPSTEPEDPPPVDASPQPDEEVVGTPSHPSPEPPPQSTPDTLDPTPSVQPTDQDMPMAIEGDGKTPHEMQPTTPDPEARPRDSPPVSLAQPPPSPKSVHATEPPIQPVSEVVPDDEVHMDIDATAVTDAPHAVDLPEAETQITAIPESSPPTAPSPALAELQTEVPAHTCPPEPIPPTTAPRPPFLPEVEIESGDEDAEGSIVDEDEM